VAFAHKDEAPPRFERATRRRVLLDHGKEIVALSGCMVAGWQGTADAAGRARPANLRPCFSRVSMATSALGLLGRVGS
jgi:hypothetical protein